MTLTTGDGTSVWNGTSNSLGLADFNLTFADNNYTDTLGLEAIEGNNTAIVDVGFLSDTPVVLKMRYFADLNSDRAINIVDITIVAKAFNSRLGNANFNEAADLNKDGVINILDITRVARDYGKTV